MGQFTFTGVCYFHVLAGGNLLSPQGSNHALGALGQGNPQDPANCYNVYSTLNSGEYIYQWDTKWLRASTPPKPPTCVPTDNSWCPTSSTSSDAQQALSM